MAELIRSRMLEGVWEGEFTGITAEPEVDVFHREQPLLNVSVGPGDNGTWRVQVPVPAEVLSDGAHTFLVQTTSGESLGSFSIIAGNAVGEDVRAEMSLLRAELDMLKKAFRRHCAETMN